MKTSYKIISLYVIGLLLLVTSCAKPIAEPYTPVPSETPQESSESTQAMTPTPTPESSQSEPNQVTPESTQMTPSVPTPTLIPHPKQTPPKLLRSAYSFNFKNVLLGKPPTLDVSAETVNQANGYVRINGNDSRRPSIPFNFDWGDGELSDGFFPIEHEYNDVSRNYIIKVVARYDDGMTESTEIPVRFVPTNLDAISLPTGVKVVIPEGKVTLQSRMPGYVPPEKLNGFDNLSFTTIQRSTIEYVLSVVASIQMDFANDDVFKKDREFLQVVLRDAAFSGMYSLWYTTPVAFAVGDYGFRGTIQWSSFMHEMGHNITLNSPAHYYYGGKIDGCANTLFSESMAQIFQHATAHYLLNNYQSYGLSDDLATEIKYSVLSSMRAVKNSHETYLTEGKKYASWNDPSTPEDETFTTFMTIAYKFFEHAENGSFGYRIPLKRMMTLLQTFSPEMRAGYDQNHDTDDAAAFRSTLMVTALSYAFDTDLRTEFRNLNFPISDIVYDRLYHALD